MKKFSIFKYQFTNYSGFTLLEMIVVISIMAVISAGGVIAFIEYSRAQSLQIATNEVVSVLHSARESTQSQLIPPAQQSLCASGGNLSSSLQGYEVSFFTDAQNPQVIDYASYLICYTLPGGANTQGNSLLVLPISQRSLPVNIQTTSPLPSSFLFNVVTGTVTTCSTPGNALCNTQVASTNVVLQNTYNQAVKTITINSTGTITVN